MSIFINLKPIDKIDCDDLKRLIDDEVYENTNIDYKSQLGFTTEGKNDLLSTCSAMANTNGGDILYGITEKRDVTGQPMGLPENIEGITIDNWDKTKLSIEQILNDYIQPHIQGIGLNRIVCANNRIVIIVRVPASILAPHMTFMDKCSRFYKRNSGGNQIMDYNEINNSFKRAIHLHERLEKFRRMRVQTIQFEGKERPIDLDGTAKIFLHILPFFSEDYFLDFSKKEIFELTQSIFPLNDNGYNFRLNFDGRLIYTKNSYVQIFRDGSVEYCDNTRFRPRRIDGEDVGVIDGKIFENDILRCTEKIIQLYDSVGLKLPIMVYITIVSVKGHIMYNNGPLDYRKLIDKDNLYFPGLIIENTMIDIAEKFKPIFDILWNAAGIPSSINYDANGKRIQ